MELKPLPFFSPGKSVLPFCLFLLTSFFSFGQSETHDFVTYDTTINYSCNTGAGGCVVGGVAQVFRLRISRPRNYFTAGNADTASRPWLVTMQGAGEVGADTNKLVTYGPHYWLNNGWDGGVQLENGKHYPILITIEGDTDYVTPPFVQALMDTLYKYFHPKPNSVHMAGLSMGVQVLTNYLGYEQVAGDEHNMAHVRSFVDLQGENPDQIGADPMAYPTFFGHWARQYGGRFFGLEGDDDSRNIWQITELMNDSVPRSAYFAYEHVGGTLNHGMHCCWNSMYDPSVTNWQDSPTISNPNIDPSYYLHPNTAGTYTVDPVTGTNIFQWMLRQGDTSLVGGGGGAPPNIPPVAHAGPDTTITLPVDSVVVTGSGTDADGTITAYAWTKLSGTGGTISAPSSATTTFRGLTAGVYQYVLTVTDNDGATGKDTMQVTVDTAVIIPPPPPPGTSETHDFITYDTTINYSCNTGADGCTMGGVVQVFSLRISRPRNYFTAGSPDTASRPWFVTMQGENEVGTDTSLLVTYGPHYWLNNGWDGGVQLGNGRHYPILITIMGQAANVTGPFVQALMDTLYKYFHPRLNSVHMAGLSMGVQVLTNYLGYEKVAGDEHNMANVKSFVDLQGQGPDGIGADPNAYPTFFGHWANKYGGRFFGLEGDNDSRNIWQITEMMNDSVANSAYFAYEHVGGAVNQGNHCCWNSMYDPSVINWQNIPPITNPNIDVSYYLHPNTAGTYTVDPVTGTNIFQWMLRQGDTTLVGGGAPANNPPAGTALQTFVAPGEYQVFFIDSTRHLYGVGTNLNTLGVGGSGIPGTTLAVAVPSNLKFKTAAGILHGGAAVDTAGNVWSWGDNDQGQVGNGSVSSSQVLTPVQVATDSSGNPFGGITALYSYYTGNASQGWFAVKSDSTLWVWGQTFGGMRGNGTAGSTSNTRPVQVPLPGGRKVMKIVAGDNLIVLFSDSTVWTCGGSGGNLGYSVSGNSYQSLQQLTALTGIKDIAGGGLFNYALKSNGTLYGWGYYGYYMGGTGGANSPLATPTDLTTRLNLPHPIRSIAVNMNCTHVILTDSTLWGWGDNAQGGIGNGQEMDFSTGAYPYSWSYAPAQLLQQSPVQVTSRRDFVALFSNYNFVMYTYAETAGGQLYSWGRNKGAVLGNGIVGCTSDIVATYPNSWDVTTPTAVNPLSITSTTVGPCPYCVAHPSTSPCNTCTTGSATKPSVAGGTGLKPGDTEAVAEHLLLYPTVSHDNEMLTMTLSSNALGSVRIRIVDMNGRVMRTLQTQKQSAYLNQVLETGHLSSGMYMVQVIIGSEKQFMAKFIRE